MKRTILMLTAVSLLLSITAFAAKEYGSLDPPIWADPAYNITEESAWFDWLDVEGAAKYSLCVELLILVDVDGEEVEVEVEVCFGTSDWNEDMSESEITIPMEDADAAIVAAIAEELGIPVEEVGEWEAVEVYAKVKALDPGKDKGRQNNEFSIKIEIED